jgi:hypothetical protein
LIIQKEPGGTIRYRSAIVPIVQEQLRQRLSIEAEPESDTLSPNILTAFFHSQSLADIVICERLASGD